MTERKQVSKRRWIWRLGFVGLLAVVLFGDVWVSKLVFHSLCSREGGEEIRSVVEGVEAIQVDYGTNVGCGARCKELLGIHRYRFVEMRVNASGTEFMTSAPGIYRFYLTERGQKECAAYDRAYETNPSYRAMMERNFDIPSSMCIASVPAKEFASNYLYESKRDYGYVKSLGIDKLEATITERSTGKVLAKRTAFSRTNGWLASVSGLDPGNQACHFPSGPLVVNALRPIRN
jgi:hypothetical protein